MSDVLYFLIYLLLCYLLAWWLNRNHPIFRNLRGVAVMFGIFLASAVIHNILSAFLFAGINQDEPFFYVATLMAIGTTFFLFLIWLARKVLPGEKPIIKDQKK